MKMLGYFVMGSGSKSILSSITQTSQCGLVGESSDLSGHCDCPKIEQLNRTLALIMRVSPPRRTEEGRIGEWERDGDGG